MIRLRLWFQWRVVLFLHYTIYAIFRFMMKVGEHYHDSFKNKSYNNNNYNNNNNNNNDNNNNNNNNNYNNINSIIDSNKFKYNNER